MVNVRRSSPQVFTSGAPITTLTPSLAFSASVHPSAFPSLPSKLPLRFSIRDSLAGLSGGSKLRELSGASTQFVRDSE